MAASRTQNALAGERSVSCWGSLLQGGGELCEGVVLVVVVIVVVTVVVVRSRRGSCCCICSFVPVPVVCVAA